MTLLLRDDATDGDSCNFYIPQPVELGGDLIKGGHKHEGRYFGNRYTREQMSTLTQILLWSAFAKFYQREELCT